LLLAAVAAAVQAAASPTLNPSQLDPAAPAGQDTAAIEGEEEEMGVLILIMVMM
jgi:hypothetical protein